MKNYIIGAIHFPPLPGYDGYPGFAVACEHALADARALQNGGVSALIIENNYDIPHVERVSAEVQEEMIRLGREVVTRASVPVGVSVLWNDYESAFIIAKAIGATFIRVPVFVDTVRTTYGVMEPQAARVREVQYAHGAEHIAVYADIHVKHAEIISGTTIAEAATQAVAAGADALIVTGKWTGDAPNVDDVRAVRTAVGDDVLVLCGSGVDSTNARALLNIANGAIVSTSLKAESVEVHAENIKPYTVRIDEEKVQLLISALKD